MFRLNRPVWLDFCRAHEERPRRILGLLQTTFAGALLRMILMLPFRPGPDLLFSRFSRVRRSLDWAQLNQPLHEPNAPEIELLLVVAGKDFRTVKHVVKAAVWASANPVGNVRLIVPEKMISTGREIFPNYEVVSELEVLPPDLSAAIEEHHPPGRYSWIFQQVLSLVAARSSSYPAVLQLDADTILMRKRQFVDTKGNQLIFISEEFHPPYEEHARKIWGPRKRFRGFSFVTHHQLWQVDILKQMFPAPGSMVDWVRMGEISESSPIAHYHCYGRWIADNELRRVRLARWGNESVPWAHIESETLETVIQKIGDKVGSPNSVSCHTFLDDESISGRAK